MGSLGPDEFRARRDRDVASLVSQISYLEEEIGLLRRKVSDSPRQTRVLEERIAEAEGRAAFLSERNDKLSSTLRDAREQLVTLKEEVDRLGQPPSGYGVFLERPRLAGAVGHLAAQETDLLLEVGDLGQQRSDVAFTSRLELVGTVDRTWAHRAPPHTSGGARTPIYTRGR